MSEGATIGTIVGVNWEVLRHRPPETYTLSLRSRLIPCLGIFLLILAALVRDYNRGAIIRIKDC